MTLRSLKWHDVPIFCSLRLSINYSKMSALGRWASNFAASQSARHIPLSMLVPRFLTLPYHALYAGTFLFYHSPIDLAVHTLAI